MEKLQKLDVTLEELDESLDNPSIAPEAETSMLTENLKEQTQTENETANEEIILDTTLQELETPKRKLKDNLSRMYITNVQDTIKAQMKADISMQCAKKELESMTDNTPKLEKLVMECEFQRDYLQNKLNSVNADRMQLVKEAQIMTSIVEILTEKLRAQEMVLGQYKSDMLDFKKATEQILNEYNLEEDMFKTQFALHETELQKCREELLMKQNELDERNKREMTEKIALEQDIESLQKEIAIAKANNEELRQTEDSLEQEMRESEKCLLELKAKLESIPLEELQKKLNQQQMENREKINRKMIELEVMNQRINDRLDNLNDVNKQIELVEEDNKKLIEENSQYKEEIAEAEVRQDSLQKELDTNRLNFNKELDSLSRLEKESVEKIEEVNANIETVISDRTKIEMETEALNEELQNLQSTISCLESKDEQLKKQLEEQTELNQSYLSKINTLTEESNDLDEEIARLDAEKLRTETDLEILQNDTETEVKKLECELNAAKEEEIELSRKESELEDAKIEGEKRLAQMKEKNLAVLKEMGDTLQRLKDQENSDANSLKELSEKLQMKTFNRDSLHTKYKKLEEEIQRLQKELADRKNVKEVTAFQKPVGILKNSNVKSPQKKVTFDRNLTWETLSESSTDSFFERILKTNHASNEQSKKETIDEIFDRLKTNSPPEHEV